VTLLLLIGVTVGPSGLDLLPDGVQGWYELLAAMALTVVAFLLGNALTPERLKAHGREIVIVSLVIVVTTIVVLVPGLVLIGAPLPVAILLAGIATATDPAATYDVIRQTGAKGRFVNLILGVVAVDDAWGLTAFALLLIAVESINGGGSADALVAGLGELFGSIALGVAIGLPAAFLTGRVRPGEPMQAECLGIVMLCAGLAQWLELSYLLSGMVAGTTVARFAQHHETAFHEIELIEWPFMLVFFLLAGASFHVAGISGAGAVLAGFIALRIASRVIGGLIGGWLAHLPRLERRWLGISLLPQAGVAIGMALVAGSRYPEYQDVIVAITVAATILFEILGPIATEITTRKIPK
jgi:Kef-type K+ transport system membrane component KefB